MISVVANRYAKALFEAALERKVTDQIENELKLIKDSLDTSEELMNWLSFPIVRGDQKKELIGKLFPDINELIRNLFFLLIDRHRTNQISGIVEAFQKLNNQHKGIVEATVMSAFPLTEEDEKQLIQTFEHLTKKKIYLVKKVDSDLLGGVIVQIGDRVYDGSLRTKLTKFQDRLKRSKVKGTG